MPDHFLMLNALPARFHTYTNASVRRHKRESVHTNTHIVYKR
jgi:hypothetical protein